MNKRRKTLLSAFVVALCILTMAGCGKSKETNTIDKNTIYREEDLGISFPENFEVNSINYANGKIYFSGYTYNYDDYNSKTMTGSVNLDGSDYKTFNVTDDSKDNWIDRMLPLSNGNLILTYNEYFSDYSDENNPIWENYYYIVMLDPNGKEICRKDLQELGVSYFDSAAELPNGNLLACSYDRIIVFDTTNLDVIKNKELSSGSEISNLFKLKDGSLITSCWGEEDLEYFKFNPDTLERGDRIDLGINTYNYSVRQGNSAYDLLLTDSTGVNGYNIGDTAVTPILNFINSDLSNTSFVTFEVYDDKTFVGAYYDWYSDENNFHVSKYTKVDPSDVKDKKIITLGCMYLDGNVRKNVIQFNKTNQDYRITVADYSQYNNSDDWNAGTDKFNMDIASGNAPDIILANGSDVSRYYAKGLFVDLNKYIKDDPEVDYNNLFPNLLEACSYNGKLYSIAPSFYVSTIIGKTSLVGDRTSWTFDEFNQFRKSLPEDMELFSGMTRESFMYGALSNNISQYVDFGKAKCYFDSPEFMSLLEFVKELPESNEDYWDTYDYEVEAATFRENKTALQVYTFSSIEDYNYQLKGTFGEDISFIGYPTNTECGSSIYYATSYAISSKCKNPEAAWDIIKYYLSDEYQSTISWGIPASMKRFDELAEEAKKVPTYTDWEGNLVESPQTYYMNGVDIEISPCTDSEIAKLKDFLLTVNRTSNYMEELETIISEEAAAFYEGQKTVEDVVKIIQSRASIYINEIQ